MIASTKETLRRHDPLAELERHLMDAYPPGGRHDLDELLARTDDDANGCSGKRRNTPAASCVRWKRVRSMSTSCTGSPESSRGYAAASADQGTSITGAAGMCDVALLMIRRWPAVASLHLSRR
jgi:hypothetical protein